MRSHLRELLTRAIEKIARGGELNSAELPPLLLEPPKQREFGDLSSNVAMLWAKSAKKPPRVIAETILKNIEDPDGILARKEIAGPGFLNFTFAAKFYLRAIARACRWRSMTTRSRPRREMCKSSSPASIPPGRCTSVTAGSR